MLEKQTENGFTLVELAIVLVIVGLLVGGVLTGQSLIEQSEINSTMNDITKMRNAIATFQQKYNETPGELQKAYAFFGSDCGTDSEWSDHGCNGDTTKDNCIDTDISSTCNVSNTVSGDLRRFFVHLHFSGIKTDLPFITDTNASSECVIGQTVPTTAIGGTYVVSSEEANKIYMYFFDSDNFEYPSDRCRFTSKSHSTTPEIAMYIDEKLDNGNGRSGKIQTIDDNNGDSYSGTDCDDANGVYNLANTTKECAFRVEFQ